PPMLRHGASPPAVAPDRAARLTPRSRCGFAGAGRRPRARSDPAAPPAPVGHRCANRRPPLARVRRSRRSTPEPKSSSCTFPPLDEPDEVLRLQITLTSDRPQCTARARLAACMVPVWEATMPDDRDETTEEPKAKAEPKPDPQAEYRDLHDRYLRLAAEFDNWKKRSSRASADAANRAEDALWIQLLPVLDSAERALEQVRGDDPIAKGIRLVYRQLLGVAEKLGIQR